MNPFEFDSEADPDRRARIAKVAYRTAEEILDRVEDSCKHKHSDGWLRCMVDHSPDKFDEFVNRYLNGEEAEELKRFIEKNSDVYKSQEEFWNEVKILYEALWDEEMSRKLGELLSDELAGGFVNIVENAEISDSTKVKRLKAYKEVLEQFANAINRALNEKKPLTELELLDWFDKMGDAVFGLKNYDYYYMIGYYVGFYDGLNDDGKLNVLNALLDGIDSVLYDVDTELSELEALTNKS